MSPWMTLLLLFIIVILLSSVAFELLKIRKLLESGERRSDTKS